MRDFSFSIGLTLPGVDGYKPVGILKLERLGVDVAWQQDTPKLDRLYSSYWFPMTAINQHAKDLMLQSKTQVSQISTNKNAYFLAASAAKSLGIADVTVPYIEDRQRNITFIEDGGDCPSGEEVQRRVLAAHGQYSVESNKKPVDANKVAMWTNVLTYLDSCKKHDASNQRSIKMRETLSEQKGVGAFDLVVEVKEYRNRQ